MPAESGAKTRTDWGWPVDQVREAAGTVLGGATDDDERSARPLRQERAPRDRDPVRAR